MWLRRSGDWTVTGKEFAHPYIFKTLFSKEPIEFEDLCETKTVTTALFLNMDESADGMLLEPDYAEPMRFVGRAGSFVPIKPGAGGGELLRQKGDKYYSATGAKGWRWLESEQVRVLGKEDDIDYEYFRELVDKAIEHIEEYIPFDQLVR